jgi:hypothetical protein
MPIVIADGHQELVGAGATSQIGRDQTGEGIVGMLRDLRLA